MSLCPSDFCSSTGNIPSSSHYDGFFLFVPADHPEDPLLVNCSVTDPFVDGGGRDGVKGGGGAGGGGGGGDGGERFGDVDEAEFSPLLKFEEVVGVAESRKVRLPEEFLEAARAEGIRQAFLERFLELQGSVWPLGWLMKHCPMRHNRMLADPSFLFKVGTEVFTNSCCATSAEVQKRGNDFWAEFELYMADLLVGLVIDIALVCMLAPYARISQQSLSLPSSLKLKGLDVDSQYCSVQRRTSIRFLTGLLIFVPGVLYGSVGFTCGLIGLGIANMIMNAKRLVVCSGASRHPTRTYPFCLFCRVLHSGVYFCGVIQRTIPDRERIRTIGGGVTPGKEFPASCDGLHGRRSFCQ